MLVLTRKLMEKLFIGDDICVTVIRLDGGQVRLGIEAPREIAVVRAELVPERQAQRSRVGPRSRGDNALARGPSSTAFCLLRHRKSKKRNLARQLPNLPV
jgi:carbon storage regulator